MRPQSSGDYVPVSLDAEDCLAIINGPAWCSRQFGSIRNWNALWLIRKTKPKYPLLVMRALCHSLTPLPFWLYSKRAQGKHLHFFFFFFFDGRNSFFWWGRENEGENESAVNCQLHCEWWLCETIVYKKRDLGTSDENTLNAECSLLSWRACCFFYRLQSCMNTHNKYMRLHPRYVITLKIYHSLAKWCCVYLFIYILFVCFYVCWLSDST